MCFLLDERYGPPIGQQVMVEKEETAEEEEETVTMAEEDISWDYWELENCTGKSKQ